MKAIIEYNLPKESYEYKVANSAIDCYHLLKDLDEKLRSWMKHGHDFKDADDALSDIRDFIRDEMIERNIPLDI